MPRLVKRTNKKEISSNFPVACPICNFMHRCINYKQAVAIKMSSSKNLFWIKNPDYLACIDHGNQRFHRCWKCYQDNGEVTTFIVSFNTGNPFPIVEVIDRMKIPTSVTESGATKSGLSFIKAAQLEPAARPGETIEFTMNGDVETNGSTDASKVLYSVPVSANRSGQKLQGQYSLNRTSLKILVGKLGDETSAWVGAHFTAFIGPTRNPQTGAQTLSFSILADSVKSAKSR